MPEGESIRIFPVVPFQRIFPVFVAQRIRPRLQTPFATYEYVASGGIDFSGAAVTRTNRYSYVASGGSDFSGVAAASYTSGVSSKSAVYSILLGNV
jgi:hypothetical protein